METADKQGAHDDSGARWNDGEASHWRQLREDASRSLAENLAEGLALSEFLSTFTGTARQR